MVPVTRNPPTCRKVNYLFLAICFDNPSTQIIQFEFHETPSQQT